MACSFTGAMLESYRNQSPKFLQNKRFWSPLEVPFPNPPAPQPCIPSPEFYVHGRASIHRRENLFLKSLVVLAIIGVIFFAGFLPLTTLVRWILVVLEQVWSHFSWMRLRLLLMEGVQLLPVGYWAGLILTSSRRAVLPISNLFCFLLMSESGLATELKRIIFACWPLGLLA